MSDHSAIEWTDATWNPVRGCTKVSPGCKHCYAETFAERFRGVAGHPYEQGFDPRLVPESLAMPLRWRDPRTVFVNSMSDLFGEFVPDDYIAACFGVMAASPRHTYQVLTKRAERLPKWFGHMAALAAADGATEDPAWHATETCLDELMQWFPGEEVPGVPIPVVTLGWPPPNVWLGVSVEDRKYGRPRIEHLRKAPAAVRFLSIEPLLEDLGTIDLTGIHWVIVGGESGPGARPMHPDWVRSIRDQCLAAEVPFFFKQWGAWHPAIDRDRDDPDWRRDYTIKNPKRLRILNLAGGHGFHGERVHLVERVGKGKSGRLIDGRTWDEMPDRAEAA